LFPALLEKVMAIEDFNAHSFESTTKQFMTDNNLGMGDVGPVLRIALAGTMQGPPVFEMAGLIGKQETVERMEIAFKEFDRLVTAA